MVLIVILSNPNAKPRKAPTLGPNTIAPIITGTWTRVALIKPRLIKPSGVNENRIIIAKKIAVKVSCFVFKINTP